MDEWNFLIVHWTARLLELSGIAAIVVGALWASWTYVAGRLARTNRHHAFREYRSSLGRSILLGLEFLIGADIIATIAIEPTIDSLVILGGIVLIRSFLSLALEVEIDGDWPWRKAVRHEDRHFTGRRGED